MKKILLVLGVFVILSTISLSRNGNSGYGGNGCMGSGFFGNVRTGWHQMMGGGYRHNMDEEEYQMIREENSKIYNTYGLEIKQKQLEVERELLEEKPDWKKIEKLNGEIAGLEGSARTEIMKNNYSK